MLSKVHMTYYYAVLVCYFLSKFLNKPQIPIFDPRLFYHHVFISTLVFKNIKS